MLQKEKHHYWRNNIPVLIFQDSKENQQQNRNRYNVYIWVGDMETGLVQIFYAIYIYFSQNNNNINKYNDELRRADPGTKVTG